MKLKFLLEFFILLRQRKNLEKSSNFIFPELISFSNSILKQSYIGNGDLGILGPSLSGSDNSSNL
jgi:hypothetical protein